MTPQKARELLGETGKHLSDEQIEHDLRGMNLLADALLDLVSKTPKTSMTKSVIKKKGR